MKCLVTGAAGFIGSSVVSRLIREGYQVKAIIHNSIPLKKEDKAEYITGDITDINSIKEAFKDVDYVIHCAAHVNDYGLQQPFYDINYHGTKNLAILSEKYNVKRFIFLSHIRYESSSDFGLYAKTKHMAENFLLEKYKENNFPVVIIRPGNVYGPGATIWVLRILESLKKNRISLIDDGKGIFLHTYIDNLLDAIILSLKNKQAIGEDFNITDDDYSITWKKYFDDLAEIAKLKPVSRNISKKTALRIGRIMIFLNKIFKIKPWVTPVSVNILTNYDHISIEKAKKLLKYSIKVNYEEGLKKINEWLISENYIK
ncbi:MAG: NAD(P)-dependent oxidoreductase [Candidatus Thermoplasmatota archaeon]|nr:NAD(P)-dependent oxidoreductase [Candidatus Thermoplasmatota archaeon]